MIEPQVEHGGASSWFWIVEYGLADADRAGAAAGRGRDGVCQSAHDDSEPGRRAALLDLRLDHDPQRRVLQVQQLREYERLRVAGQ